MTILGPEDDSSPHRPVIPAQSRGARTVDKSSVSRLARFAMFPGTAGARRRPEQGACGRPRVLVVGIVAIRAGHSASFSSFRSPRTAFGLPDEPRSRRDAWSPRSVPRSAAARDLGAAALLRRCAAAAVRRARQRGRSSSLVRAVRGSRAATAGPRATSATGSSSSPSRARSRSLEAELPRAGASGDGRRFTHRRSRSVDEHATAAPSADACPRLQRDGRRARTSRASRRRRRRHRHRCCTKTAYGSARMSLFYEQWLGKLPISELERVSLLVRHRRGARGGLRAREAPARPRARGLRRASRSPS